MLAFFFRPKYRLIWSLFFIKVYVSSTKAKQRNSAYFKISEQNPVSVKKNTWYILNFIEALAGSQMKVKATLNNFYNFISYPAQCMCQSSTPIRNMYNLHNTQYKISYNSISKPCVEQNKRCSIKCFRNISWDIYMSSISQNKIYPYFA